jgi:hypothetical protein
MIANCKVLRAMMEWLFAKLCAQYDNPKLIIGVTFYI